jgi:hypothetical protein
VFGSIPNSAFGFARIPNYSDPGGDTEVIHVDECGQEEANDDIHNAEAP